MDKVPVTAWPQRRIGDLARNVTVGFVGSMSKYFVEEGVPLLRGQNVRPYQLDLANLKFVPHDIHVKWKKSSLNPGDIVIVRVGYPGIATVIPPGLGDLNAASLVIVRPNTEELNPKFLAYVLNSPWGKGTIDGLLVGSAQQVLNTNTVASMPIPAPPLPIQERIVAILSGYTELIENNVRRIEILEEMAQAIYREWFVHFRFPGNEAVQLGHSDAAQVPQGWKLVPLGDIAEVVKGLSYKGSHLRDGGLPMANLKNFAPVGGFRRDGLKEYNGPFKDRHAVVAGDLIVANTDLTQAGNIVGSVAKLPRSLFPNGGLLTHHLFRVRAADHSPIGITYLRAALGDVRFRDWAKGHASGTTVLGFRREDAERFPVLVPPESIVTHFESLVEPIWELAETLETQSEVSGQTRDLLLPKLISGEINVSELDIDTSWLAA